MSKKIIEDLALYGHLLSHLDGEIQFIRSIEEKNQMTRAIAGKISDAESAILSLDKFLDKHPETRSQSINSVVISFKHLMISIDPKHGKQAREICKLVIDECKKMKRRKVNGGTRKRNHRRRRRTQKSRRR